MAPDRKLRPKHERDIAIEYLCGLTREIICPLSCISGRTLQRIIRRQKPISGPLVEFYSQSNGNITLRRRNSAHLYISIHDGEIESGELVDKKRDGTAFNRVHRYLYSPRDKNSLRDLALYSYLGERVSNLYVFRQELFDSPSPTSIFRSFLMPRLKEEYSQNDKFSLDRAYENTKSDIRKSILLGEMSLSPKKIAQVVDAIGEAISDKERNILIMNFGLNGENPLNGAEIGRRMKLTRERIRQILNSALGKIRSSECYQELDRILSIPVRE